MHAYLKALERTVGLPSGVSVRLRPIRPDDEASLIALYARLSPDTAYQRFFSRMARLPRAWAHRFANVDYRRRFAVVAELDMEPERALIGVARYEAYEDGVTAEVALVVEDRWQRQGLGGTLLDEVLRGGNERGIDEFRAYVLAANRRMLDLLARRTDVVRTATSQGVTEVLFRRRVARPHGAGDKSGPSRAWVVYRKSARL
jgi:acetyltransferase